MILGDAAGFVDVPSLKGIHYAMQSGIFAARVAFQALKSGDNSAASLGAYDRMVADSYIARDLYRTRNMRLAFKDGFYLGGAKAGLMTLTGGRFPGGRIAMPADASVPRATVEQRPSPLTACSPSASWMRCSSQETRPATPSLPTCWSARI